MSNTQAAGAAIAEPVTRSILANAALVSGIGTTVKIAGALKVIVMARRYGAGDALDAFLIAFLIPSLVADTLAGPLSAALVPAFVSVKEQSGAAAAEQMYQRVLAWILLVLFVVVVVVALGSPLLLPVIASGFSPAKRELTQHLLLFLLPVLPLGGLGVAWRARLNADADFAIAAAAPAAVPILTMLAIVLYGRDWGVYALVAGTIGGGILEVFTLAIGLRRRGHHLLPRWSKHTPEMDAVLKQYLPVMAATLLFGGSLLIDQALAAKLTQGSVSALTFGTKLVTVMLGIATAGMSTAILPQLSRLAARGEWDILLGTVKSQARIVLAGAVCGTVILLACSDLLVRILFHSGAFTDEAARLVVAVQRAALLRLPFSILLAMLMGVVSALRQNQILVRVGFVALLLNGGLDLFLMQSLGVIGIPLAGSIAQAAAASYLAWIVWKTIRSRISETIDGYSVSVPQEPAGGS